MRGSSSVMLEYQVKNQKAYVARLKAELAQIENSELWYRVNEELKGAEAALAGLRKEWLGSPNKDLVELLGDEGHDAVRSKYSAITAETAITEETMLGYLGRITWRYHVPINDSVYATEHPVFSKFDIRVADINQWYLSKGYYYLICYCDGIDALLWKRL